VLAQIAERDDKGRFVNHGAFHAEREERKKAEAEARELREWKARVEERFKLAQEQKAAQEKPESDDPFADVEESDFIAKIDRITDLIRQDRKQKVVAERQTAEQRAADDSYRQHFEYVDRSYVQAAGEDPEVAEATKSIIDSYSRELETMGYRGTHLERAKEQTTRNFILAASNVLQQGGSLKDFVKGMAQLRGWQAKAPEPKKDEVAEKLAGIEKAQEQSRTLGQASGKAAGDPDSLESIMAMSPKDFEAWHANPQNARRFEKLMGA